MKSITQNASVEIPPVEEPEEYDPVSLFWSANQKFRWSDEAFATNFGCEVSTVRKWLCGQKVGKLSRIRAATLKRDWEL